MAIYNIIYTSPDNEAYLWNGSGFDLLRNEENDKLFYSGKSYDEDEVAQALLKSYNLAKAIFPDDNDVRLDPIEIQAGDNDAQSEHRHHMTS